MKTQNHGKRKFDAGLFLVSLLFSVLLYPFSWVIITLWNLGDIIINDAAYYGESLIALYALLLSLAIGVALYISEHIKSDRQKEIDAKFNRDKTSICPHCGGEDIKIYPKGYDYSFGFLGRLMGFKSAPFLAGMDSNIACCRCRSCGKNWQTPYDYRSL